MKPRANPDHFTELRLVITLAQAVREYHVCRKTLSIAIDLDKIAAKREGRNVLISRRSLENYLFPTR